MKPTILLDSQDQTTFFENHFPTFTRIFQSLALSKWLEKLNLRVALRTLVTATLLTTFGASHAQAYEMFGKEAWNVGSHVDAPAYGRPSAAVFREDANNPHLLHSVHQGQYGKMYVNKATGKCLIAHGNNAGALVGYWECNSNDPKMNWKLHHIGGGAYLFESVAYRGRCMDNPVRQNAGLVHLWYCDGKNYNQKFWRVQTHGGHQDGAPWYVPPVAQPPVHHVVRLNVTQYSKPLTLIRTGGTYAGRQWEPHQYVFTRTGQIRSGADQRFGDEACNYQWDILPPTKSVLRNAQISNYNGNTQRAEAEGEIAGKGSVKGFFDVGGRLRGLFENTNETSNTSTDTVEFEVLYRADVNDQPIFNPTAIWYHSSLGLCIADVY